MTGKEKAQWIAADIRAKIASKEYVYGTSIPSERALAELYGTSRSVVRTALEFLIEENLIKQVHGKGNFVTKTQIDDTGVHFKGMTELLTQAGFTPSARVLKTQVRQANYKFSRIFDVPEDTAVFQVTRLRLGNEQPISIENTYILYDSVKNVEQIDFQVYSLYDIFHMNQIHIHSIRHIFSGTRLSATFSKLLELSANTPVVSIHLTSTTSNGKAAEYTEVFVAPNFSKFYTDGVYFNGKFVLDTQPV